MISGTLIKIASVLHDYVELLTSPIVALVRTRQNTSRVSRP